MRRSIIDQLHHAMQLWKEEKRDDLVNYLRENELLDHVPYWKLAQALFEACRGMRKIGN